VAGGGTEHETGQMVVPNNYASLDGAGAPPASPLERPEVAIGAAFLGGLLLAALVSRIGR